MLEKWLDSYSLCCLKANNIYYPGPSLLELTSIMRVLYGSIGGFLHSHGEREKLLMCSWLRMFLIVLITIILLLCLISRCIWPSAGSLGQVQNAPQQDELGLWLQQSLRDSQISVYEQHFKVHCKCFLAEEKEGGRPGAYLDGRDVHVDPPHQHRLLSTMHGRQMQRGPQA